MTKDLLWELGLEEVPARFLPPAIKQLETLSAAALGAAGLNYRRLDVYATPRRLALLVSALAEQAADTESEVKGPAVKAAYNEHGAPTRALQGFLRSQGTTAADLREKEINNNLYVCAVKKQVGRATAELLPELLSSLVEKIYFPKPMRWGYHTLRFVRPIRWMVALFGIDVIDLELSGVRAGRATRGHRLLGSDHIELRQPNEYLPRLRENYVIVDQNERRDLCWKQIQAVAASLGGQVKDDAELLEEVTFILEYPTALAGHFAEKYLLIPEELVITPMREHQRYFPVYGGAGNLLPRFITVRNGDGRFLATVAEGNEKVLRARLADAEFFYSEDLKDKMGDKVEALSAVVFHEKLGTMREKVARMIKIAEEIGRRLGYGTVELEQTRRAAYLAKADLGSRAVYEFPELQGVMGEYYAKAAGEDPVVAQAIREHYLPRNAGDELPESKPGVAVALADKLDSICGFFSIGLIPSGSQDPYALRRAAAGCVNIIIKHQLKLNLRELLPVVFELVGNDAAESKDQPAEQGESVESAIRFLFQRLETILDESGVGYDVINAVSRVGLARADLLGALRRAQELNSYRRSEGFPALLAGFTRAANILRSVQDRTADGVAVQEGLFGDASERALYAALQEAEHTALPLAQGGEYARALEEISRLTPLIDAFFTAVLVLDKDESIRRNRLALLRQIVSLTAEIGDLSQIVG